MKKFIPLALAFSVLTSGAITVSAANQEKIQVESHKRGQHFKRMKNFQEQVHKANALKIERLEIQKEIVKKKDQLFDMHVKAGEQKVKEKRSANKASWQEMKQIHQDLRTLQSQAHETKKAMHEALRANNEKLALEKMNQWLSLNEKINNKLSEKSAKLDEVLAKHK
ncbi:hypothetical protein [Fictibacillus norfolkensis]|uniref:Uncharacterized protein n=1 Tax=Fictibacillus norfolkensis TaxID=2762233 RepID=A0ABR8SQM8_9BACL|nr:hypothetical protein [Fictibacillus norfolkensis]MBD7965808.1 hypothetical protein [Fictibacillus norfolkensis]